MEPTRGGGDPAFLNRSSGKLKVFMDQHRPEHLVAELPMDPSRPLAAVRDEDAWTFMKDLVQRHRGELREIIGEKQNQFLSTFESSPLPTSPDVHHNILVGCFPICIVTHALLFELLVIDFMHIFIYTHTCRVAILAQVVLCDLLLQPSHQISASSL